MIYMLKVSCIEFRVSVGLLCLLWLGIELFVELVSYCVKLVEVVLKLCFMWGLVVGVFGGVRVMVILNV